jgi:hypothetical protein
VAISLMMLDNYSNDAEAIGMDEKGERQGHAIYDVPGLVKLDKLFDVLRRSPS